MSGGPQGKPQQSSAPVSSSTSSDSTGYRQPLAGDSTGAPEVIQVIGGFVGWYILLLPVGYFLFTIVDFTWLGSRGDPLPWTLGLTLGINVGHILILWLWHLAIDGRLWPAIRYVVVTFFSVAARLLGAVLALPLYLAYWLGLQIYQGLLSVGILRHQLTPGEPQEEAERQAAERRAKVDVWLLRHRSSRGTTALFREIAPSLEHLDKLFLEQLTSFNQGTQPVTPATHLTNLTNQRQAAPTLLASRVVDTVYAAACWHNLPVGSWHERGERSTIILPTVKLRYRPLHGRFPWRVEVMCSWKEMQEFRQPLRNSAAWLAIGIDWRPRWPVRLTGRGCAALPGSRGTLGGLVQVFPPAGRMYGVTCAHVVCDECQCWVTRPANGAPAQDPGPDLALVKATTPCFPAPDLKAPADLQVMNLDARLNLVQRRTPVTMRGHTGRASIGHVSALVQMLSPVGDRPAVEFAQLQVTPHFLTYLFGLVRWPLRPSFSRPGDSGGWVTTVDRLHWVGVVFADHPWLGTSYATAAHEGVQYLEQHIPRRRIPAGVHDAVSPLSVQEPTPTEV